jgi:cation diffusion facilitator family transporter
MNTEKERNNRLRQGRNLAFFASLVILLLALGKGVVGYLFDSHLLVADAFHSAGDMVTVAASGFGLWLAARRKTERFPYGLYKAETIATLFIGMLIVWAGVEMARDGFSKFFHASAVPEFPLLPVLISAISVVTSLILARKEDEVGKAVNSQSLQVTAREMYLDTFVSAAVLIGILMAFWRIPHVEGGLIIVISLLILKLGGESVWMSILSLLDANLDPRLQAEIEQKIAGTGGVQGVPELRVRRSGPFRMIDCTIESSPHLPLYRAHELADKIEDAVTGDYNEIETVFIHVEPSREKVLSALIPVTEVNGLDSRIHGHFGRAPYFVIVRFDGNNIEIVDFYYNEFLGEKIHIGVKIIKSLIHSGLNLLFSRAIGELSFYMLKENFIDIYHVEEEFTVGEIIQAYREKRLPILTAPTHSLEESETITHEAEETERIGR